MSVSVVETISTHTLTWSVTASEDYCKGRHCISTHTLTWSVTNSVIAFRTITLISTHTLTWSVTEWFIGILDKSKDFNSHAHVERDFHHKSCPLRKLLISTHTLTWSVTICITFKISAQAISTHTLTWSVTKYHTKFHRLLSNFNSHAHVERDHLTKYFLLFIAYFNSHAHVERDPLKSCNVATILISTHTLTWSVTYSGFATGTNYQISTHTLTWSVTVVYLYDE